MILCIYIVLNKSVKFIICSVITDKNENQNESCSNQTVNSSSSLGILNNDKPNFQETQNLKTDG